MEKQYIEKRNRGYWLAGTRVSLDSVILAFLDSLSPETIVSECFPVLTLEQVYGAITYYLSRRDETELDVAESILNAVAIYKKLRSRSPFRQHAKEYLYVIQSTNLDGRVIYTQGKLVSEPGVETYYFLVSSTKAM